MAKAIDLIIKAANYDDGEHERKLGRYYASEIYSIKKGYLKPKDFFERKAVDEMGAMNIEGGNADENHWAFILMRNKIKYNWEPKKVMHITKEIDLVVKPDFIINDKFILETKSPMYITKEIPEKWKDQLCCEAKAFGLPIYLGVFRNNTTRRFSLDEYRYEYEPKRWDEIVEILESFDKKLRNLHTTMQKL